MAGNTVVSDDEDEIGDEEEEVDEEPYGDRAHDGDFDEDDEDDDTIHCYVPKKRRFSAYYKNQMNLKLTFKMTLIGDQNFNGTSITHTEQEKTRKEKELAKKHFKPRMIVHPRFQNITSDGAVEFLSDEDPGESVIRPNARGPSHLTLTLKIYDGVYANKNIVEGGKGHNDITSLLRIGKTLKIGEDTFEDLDEVMDRYVEPLVAHLKAMLNYRKFRKGTKYEIDELLRIEKSENPIRIVYCLGHEHPGTFILTYIRGSNPHHEYISLYPKGFKFRKRMFEDIDRLVAYFQRNIDDPLNSAPSI